LEELGYEPLLLEGSAGAPADEVDLVVVNLNGTAAITGAFEAGLARGNGLPCVGLKTDGRGGSDTHDAILAGRVATSLDELRAMLCRQSVVVDLHSGTGDITIDLRPNERSYIAVSGPLGVGKTTLINLMASTGAWTVLPEPVMDNPYLSKVYANLSDYAFRNQAFYIGQRAALHNSARGMSGSIIQERCLSEDSEVFTRVMHDLGAIDDADLETLMTLSRALLENAPQPDLILYLAAPFEVTVARIRERDRSGEGDLDTEFLRRVYERYEQWSAATQTIPLRRIDTAELDYAHRPEDGAEMVRRIERSWTDTLVLA
jgi:deoxyadenosine/deoxycytidine kinase